MTFDGNDRLNTVELVGVQRWLLRQRRDDGRPLRRGKSASRSDAVTTEVSMEETRRPIPSADLSGWGQVCNVLKSSTAATAQLFPQLKERINSWQKWPPSFQSMSVFCEWRCADESGRRSARTRRAGRATLRDLSCHKTELTALASLQCWDAPVRLPDSSHTHLCHNIHTMPFKTGQRTTNISVQLAVTHLVPYEFGICKLSLVIVMFCLLLILIQSFILNLRVGFLAKNFLHWPFHFPPDWFYGLLKL